MLWYAGGTKNLTNCASKNEKKAISAVSSKRAKSRVKRVRDIYFIEMARK
jgi:hypothetical protein